MKGFKNSSKTRSGFSFPSSAGFTGSTGKTQDISYTRKTPHRKPVMKAEGGTISRQPGFPPRRTQTGGALENLRKAVMPQAGKKSSSEMVDKAISMQDHKKGGAIMKKATGGVVDSALQGREPASSALDQESGGKSPLRPGFAGGGLNRFLPGGSLNAMAPSQQRPMPGAVNMGMSGPARMGLGSPGRVTLPQQVMGRSVMRARGGTTPQFAKGGRIPAHRVAARAEKGINQSAQRESGGKLLK